MTKKILLILNMMIISTSLCQTLAIKLISNKMMCDITCGPFQHNASGVIIFFLHFKSWENKNIQKV